MLRVKLSSSLIKSNASSTRIRCIHLLTRKRGSSGLIYPALLPLHNHVRYLCTNSDFKEALNRLKGEKKEVKEQAEATSTQEEVTSEDNQKVDADTGTPPPEDSPSSTSSSSEQKVNFKEMYRKAMSFSLNAYDVLKENVILGWEELRGDNKPSALKRKVHQAESFKKGGAKGDVNDDEEEKEEERDPNQTYAMVLVKDPVGAWDQMKARLQESPFIREILKNSRKIGDAASKTTVGQAAQKTATSVQDKIEDAREFWETSQNPIVYTISGVWENLTGETDEAIALSEIKRLDPQFSKEVWSEEVKRDLVPLIIQSHLKGDLKVLKQWMGEAVYSKLAADIRMRKMEGITIDTNILDIEENQFIMKHLESGETVIVTVYMVQQIHCVRNKAGEIVEGGEADIRAKFWCMSFQQVYDEDSGEVSYKIQDYVLLNEMAYL